jgi:hypothetical protein
LATLPDLDEADDLDVYQKSLPLAPVMHLWQLESSLKTAIDVLDGGSQTYQWLRLFFRFRMEHLKELNKSAS